MGMECPAALAVPLGLIGMEWPKGDEDAMDRLSRGWHQYALDIDLVIEDLGAVSSTLDTAIGGDEQKAIHEQLTMLQSGGKSLREIVEEAEFLAERCDMMSTELTALKVVFIVELVALMIFIEIALSTAYFNWAAPAEIAAEEAATQLTLRQVIEQMVERILEEFTVKAFLKNAAKNFAMEAAKTAIEESLKEGRDHWMWGTGYDVKKVAGESLKSGLAGSALTPLSTPVEKVTGTLFEGGLKPLLSRGLQNSPGLRFGADVLADHIKDKDNEQLLDKPTETAKKQLESAGKWLTKPEPENPHSAPSSPDATPASPSSVPSATPSPGTPPLPATQAGTAPTPATPDSTSTTVPSR